MTKTKQNRARARSAGTRRVVGQPEPVVASKRYTPPGRFSYIYRPIWHKVVGGAILVSGFALFVSCEASIGNIHAYGGHIWFIVGLAIAASSTWWFGLFDQPA